jgi:hypothetical protein
VRATIARLGMTSEELLREPAAGTSTKDPQ